MVRDPADNRVLEAAVTAPADAVATGNSRHLRVLGEFEGIPIRTRRSRSRSGESARLGRAWVGLAVPANEGK